MGSLRLMSRHWIVDENDNIIIGDGRKEILENIEKTGSLNQTAKVMKMSYKAVWSKVKVTEEYLNMRIVDTDKKRGSSLTEEGKALLEKYNQLQKRCHRMDDQIFEDIFQ